MYKKLIHGRYLPPRFELQGDPSHMKVEDAKVFLNFLIKRQRSDPSDVFKFTRWLNHKGELQEGSESESADESSDGRSKSTGRPAKANVGNEDKDGESLRGIHHQ